MNKKINALILGSGGREHAIAWHIAKSIKLGKLYVAPGNSGTIKIAQNIKIDINNYEKIREIINKYDIRLLFIGPEEPLVNGLHDKLLDDTKINNLKIIGPQAKGAKLEGSKLFAKQFMEKYNIPTASYKSFTKKEAEQAKYYVTKIPPPFVIKADGLAAGKGVFICQSAKEGAEIIDKIIIKSKFGNAGDTIVIESFLKGREMSVFILTDGQSYKILPTAKDYKQIGDGDVGLNTGGMGAVSPVSFVDKALMQKVIKKIIEPTLFGLNAEKIPYSGFIFFGLINVAGEPFVIEYNARLGDPETQTIIPRINSDLLELFWAIDQPKVFEKTKLDISSKSSATVILTSGGYPESYKKGYNISGLQQVKNAHVFHAGLQLKDNRLITNGGRVMAITTLKSSLKSAIETSYNNVQKIKFKDMYFRKDIGKDLIK
tara:strand:+ start:38 stop:1330 length:1293 start_codon:yes stop_codon:yes gene_type:complete